MPAEPLAVTRPPLIRPLPRTESELLLAGSGGPAPGLSWAEDYPTADTGLALALLDQAYRALGLDVPAAPVWWLHQIVVDSVVVGDIGFHGPPGGRPARVEIGYAVVPSRRREGIATAACRLLVDLAFRSGATEVTAEAAGDNPASRTVLRRAGFRPAGGDRFLLAAPARAGRKPR